MNFTLTPTNMTIVPSEAFWLKKGYRITAIYYVDN